VRGWGRVEWGIGLEPTSIFILDQNPLADVMGSSPFEPFGSGPDLPR
jgi:hypothetical protein